MITIINYGVGNLGSFSNILKKAGITSCITSDPDKILKADKLILPGVGSFDYGMQNLENSGLIPALNESVLVNKKPILGVCLGAQLMTERSDEGQLKGLGWVKGVTVKFDKNLLAINLKVPHMGWNEITYLQDHPIFTKMPVPARFYHVHSYHFSFSSVNDLVANTTYGYTFPVAFAHNNIIGVQFHPEKSHKFGLQLLQNFANLI